MEAGIPFNLGTSTDHPQSERRRVYPYTFTIPAGQNEFNLIYHYALVHLPPHPVVEMPRFIVEIENLTDGGTLLSDGALHPGQRTAGFFDSPINPEVKCKNWAAASIKLNGYAGKHSAFSLNGNLYTQRAFWLCLHRPEYRMQQRIRGRYLLPRWRFHQCYGSLRLPELYLVGRYLYHGTRKHTNDQLHPAATSRNGDRCSGRSLCRVWMQGYLICQSARHPEYYVRRGTRSVIL